MRHKEDAHLPDMDNDEDEYCLTCHCVLEPDEEEDRICYKCDMQEQNDIDEKGR